MISQALSRARLEYQRLRSSKAIVGMFWTLFGTGAGQVIRLLSNIVLAYLLAPEIFGVMALAYTVIIGLGQVSDVGLREGVVNSDRIHEAAFMRTAWTLQILRAAFMAVVAAALAIPIANFYEVEILAPVIMMIGASIFITGFKSVALMEYDKRLDLKRQMVSDLAVQVSGLVVVITWAWISPSVWALVAGQIFSSILEVIISYALFKGHHSKLGWDKEAVSSLFHFGKWIVLSSSISFIGVQGDRLIMKLYMTLGDFGLYSIASNWAALVAIVASALSVRVLHPYFRSNFDGQSDYARVHQARVLLNTAYMFICMMIAIFGHYIVVIIYDDRYLNVGWMLQVLAVGQVGRSATGTLLPFLAAKGDSFSLMLSSSISAILLVSFILIGGWLGGSEGVVVAYAMTGLVVHPVMALFALKHGYSCLRTDLSIAAVGIFLIGVFWYLTDAPALSVIGGLIGG
jgi:O-antigen/teichoic acid export membrane protein